jgi:hypothetical protein
MFDVFYYGPKPNLFEFEQPADSLEAAAALTRTGYYCIFMGAMITQTLILIIKHYPGKVNTRTRGPINGINMVAHI